MLNRFEIAAMISEALGKPIEARTLTFQEWVAQTRPPYDPAQLELLATVYEHYSRYGLGLNSISLTAALQWEPRSTRAFIHECAESRAQ
jgi:hypothetical protein